MPESAQVQHSFDPQAGGYLRGAVMFLPCLLWAIGYLIFLYLWALILPKLLLRHRVKAIRLWGQVQLKLLGIRMEVHGQENLDTPGPKILLFNHISAFDMAVLSSTYTARTSVIYKKEFHRIPVMGRVMRFFGMIPIDRSNHEAAIRTLAKATEQIKQQNLHVLIAPEGTRSRDGSLGTFKKGPFHMALQSGAPLIPVVTQGIESLVPGGSPFARSGVIRVNFLPEIPTQSWNRRNLNAHMEEVRNLFAQYHPKREELKTA
jgi:1-acyl-sn-glycerol-3-phosphate acyltransferase